MGAIALLLQNGRQVSDLIMSGVLARYPTIKFDFSAAVQRYPQLADCLLEQSGFELPRPLAVPQRILTIVADFWPQRRLRK
jgi:hypothetical protein